jgi:hypothetical protein
MAGRVSSGIIALRAAPVVAIDDLRQGIQLYWNNQFEFTIGSPVTGPPRVLVATGGPPSGGWTDDFADLSAWHYDERMHAFGGLPTDFVTASGGAIYGTYLTTSSATRNDPAPGDPQFVQVDVADMWQHAGAPAPWDDTNLRGVVNLVTHYDPVSGADQYGWMAWQVQQPFSNDPEFRMGDSSGANIAVAAPTDVAVSTYRFEAYAGHLVSYLNGSVVLSS